MLLCDLPMTSSILSSTLSGCWHAGERQNLLASILVEVGMIKSYNRGDVASG